MPYEKEMKRNRLVNSILISFYQLFRVEEKAEESAQMTNAESKLPSDEKSLEKCESESVTETETDEKEVDVGVEINSSEDKGQEESTPSSTCTTVSTSSCDTTIRRGISVDSCTLKKKILVLQKTNWELKRRLMSQNEQIQSLKAENNQLKEL